MPFPELVAALNLADISGKRPRELLESAFDLAGVYPVAWSSGVNKVCAIFGAYVVKAGSASVIASNLRLSEKLGPHAAETIAIGGRWMIQQRVAKLAKADDFARFCASEFGAHDIRYNSGLTDDGRTVAFDGFLRSPKLTTSA